MGKRFWISGVVMTVATLLLGWFVHGFLLAGDYSALTGTIMRTPEESGQYMHWMLVADVCIGFAMTWIYRQGIDAGKSVLGQGLRFGVAVALLTVIPQFLIYYTVERLPGTLVHKQLIFDSLRMIVLGVLVAYLNPRSRTS